MIISAIMLAALMQTLDSTIINVALPYIQGNLGVAADSVTWVITGFIISNVVVIPLTPWLSMRLGRKEYFALSIAGFTIASALCGSANSFGQLVFYRVLQGAFGGGLLAVAQPLLKDTMSPEELGISQAIFAIGAVCGPALGPWIGGMLTDAYSWRWVFWVNILPGIIATAIIWTMLRNPQKAQRLPVDGLGIAFLALAVGSLQYVLDEGENKDWFSSKMICYLTVTAVIGFIAFTVRELKGTKKPIINLRLLAKRAVGVGSIISLSLGIPMFGTTLILPQYVSNILGFTATMSGDLLLVRAAPMALLTPVAGLLLQSGKVDSRAMLGTGLLITGIGSIWLALCTTSGTSFDAMMLPLIVQGVGGAILFVPLLVTVMGSVEGQESSMASAFINLFFQLGGSFASALLVTLLDRRADLHQDRLAANITLGSAPVTHLIQTAGQQAHQAVIGLWQVVTLEANAMGFADVFFAIGAAALVVLPLLFAMPKPTNTDVEIEMA
ncbi:MAG: DHA2 family efflux MFS transporter permease subunit [Silvibacterium sp.]|nr:DHA2 family efflux MFS transporter permease subunit [Silvibacterium sp.]